MHDSGHACVVNGAVLDLLPTGVPHHNGVLTEQGMAAVRALRAPYATDELLDAIEIEIETRTCLAEGVTACTETGIGAVLISHSPVELVAYQQALEQGRLAIRVQLMVAGEALRPIVPPEATFGGKLRCTARPHAAILVPAGPGQ